MYAIYAYIGVVLGVNVGIYGIHGVSGIHIYILRNWRTGEKNGDRTPRLAPHQASRLLWQALTKGFRGENDDPPERFWAETLRSWSFGWVLWLGRFERERVQIGVIAPGQEQK